MWIFPTHCNTRPIAAAGRQQNRLYGAAMMFAAGCILLSGTVAAQTTSSTLSTVVPTVTQAKARLIEWDLPPQADTSPGAMVVDTQGDDRNRLWFVTRALQPHVYRMNFPSSLMKG